jgi:hypothetical protein
MTQGDQLNTPENRKAGTIPAMVRARLENVASRSGDSAGAGRLQVERPAELSASNLPNEHDATLAPGLVNYSPAKMMD